MSARHFVLVALCPSILAGCQSLTCGDGTEEEDGQCVASEGDDDTAAGSAEGAPELIAFTSNVTTIGYGESVTFTAIVTHPAGVAQVIGGMLQSGGGATYGAFSTAGDEGAYSMTLSWWDINHVNAISLATGADGLRPFNAYFYDVDGDYAEARLDIGLTCDGEPSCEGICGSTCSADTGQ